MSALDEERLERIIDDLLWAIDHVASRWDRVAEDARVILQSARAHNEGWHARRSLRETTGAQPRIDETHQ